MHIRLFLKKGSLYSNATPNVVHDLMLVYKLLLSWDNTCTKFKDIWKLLWEYYIDIRM